MVSLRCVFGATRSFRRAHMPCARLPTVSWRGCPPIDFPVHGSLYCRSGAPRYRGRARERARGRGARPHAMSQGPWRPCAHAALWSGGAAGRFGRVCPALMAAGAPGPAPAGPPAGTLHNGHRPRRARLARAGWPLSSRHALTHSSRALRRAPSLPAFGSTARPCCALARTARPRPPPHARVPSGRSGPPRPSEAACFLCTNRALHACGAPCNGSALTQGALGGPRLLASTHYLAPPRPGRTPAPRAAAGRPTLARSQFARGPGTILTREGGGRAYGCARCGGRDPKAAESMCVVS